MHFLRGMDMTAYDRFAVVPDGGASSVSDEESLVGSEQPLHADDSCCHRNWSYFEANAQSMQ